MRSLDEVFEDVGDFGSYQKKLYCFLLVTATFPVMQRWVWDVITVAPQYWCRFPFEVAPNSSVYFEPGANNEGSGVKAFITQLQPCRTYQLDANMSGGVLWSNTSLLYNSSQQCTSWIYDTTNERIVGIVAEYNLVCQKSHLISLSTKIYMWCEVTGYIFWGILSDRFGRKKVFFISLILQSTSGFLAGMVTTISGVIALRGAIGFFSAGCFIGAILRMEYVGPSMRMVTGMMDCAMAGTGKLVVALLIVLLTNWRHVQIVSSIPPFLFLSCWWFVPESARWLLVHNKEREARRIISKMATKNRRELTIDSYESEEDQNKRFHQSNPINLCCFSKTRTRLFILLAMWLANGIAFHCISEKWMPQLHSDYLVHIVLSALIDQPAFAMCLFTLNRFGRRFPIAVSMVSTGLLLTIYLVVPSDFDHLLLAILIFSKITSAAAFAGLYVFSIELQSSAVRSSALGLMISCQFIGEIVGLPIQYLKDVWEPLPIALTAAISSVIGFLVFLLPETTGYYMPDRLQDVEIESENDEEEENAFSGRRVSMYVRNRTPVIKIHEMNPVNQDFVQE